MEPKPIDLTDWHRILAGSTSWNFLIEVFFRAAFIYLLLMFAMRLLGKRLAAQLSLFELSMVVTLAAATGVSLEVENRGLLPPIIILILIILLQRNISRCGLKHRLVERLASGDEAMLVRDGRVLLEAMRKSVLSREKLYTVLRGQGIQHLGQVERVFLEASGDFSVLRAQNPPPGLSLIPASDPDLRGKPIVEGYYACTSCGYTTQAERLPNIRCEYCDSTNWARAVAELADE